MTTHMCHSSIVPAARRTKTSTRGVIARRRPGFSVLFPRCVSWNALVGVVLCAVAPTAVFGEFMTFEGIRDTLHANPPTTGDPVLREDAIRQLDAYLMLPLAPTPFKDEYLAFSRDMMEGLADEIAQPVPSGARIWKMYNHAYIVKTPSTTFAFDLITYGTTIPTSVIEEIDVAFISHFHNDHISPYSYQVAELGGELVTTETLPPGNQAMIGGLKVQSYFGLHGGIINNIYHVTTPEGLTVMHTGDTQQSNFVPDDVPTDILLINVWMNESGYQHPTVGVRNAINRVQPDLTIPGHIQELNHAQSNRFTYDTALAVDDVPIPGDYVVMVPGEYYDYNVVPEPSVLVLLGIGVSIALLAGRSRRTRTTPTGDSM